MMTVLKQKSILFQLLLFCLCILIFGMGAIIRGQDINWDLLQYHFYNGYAFLHHRFNYDIAPAMVQTFYNPILDVINYLLIAIQKPKLTEFLLGAFSGVSCFLLYKSAIIFFSNTTPNKSFNTINLFALFTVLIGMTGAGGISLLNTTTNDTKISMLVMMSIYYMLKALSEKKSNYTLLAALLIGLCTGFKLTTACYAVGLFAALLFAKKWDRKHIHLSLYFLCLVVIGFLLANGYWMYMLYERFQNPIFPHYNNLFHSSYAPYLSFNFPIGKQNFYLYHLLLLPFSLAFKNTLTSEMLLRDMRLGMVFLMAIIALLSQYKKYIPSEESRVITRFMFIFFFVSYLFWLIVFLNYRYILPLEMLTGLFIVYFLQQWIRGEILRLIALIILTIMLIATTHYPTWASKQSYKQEYFSVTVPSLPKRATIIVATVPLSYVIPFFPERIRFVGMTFLSIGLNDATREEILAKKYLFTVMQNLAHNINSTPIYTLAFAKPDHFEKRCKNVMKQFNLVTDETNCQFFKTNIGDNLKLCSVKSEIRSQ